MSKGSRGCCALPHKSSVIYWPKRSIYAGLQSFNYGQIRAFYYCFMLGFIGGYGVILGDMGSGDSWG